MRNAARLLLLLLLAVLSLLAGAASAGGTYFGPAPADLRAALEQANAQGKSGVALLFELQDCSSCVELKRTALPAPRVRRAYGPNFSTFVLGLDSFEGIKDFQGRITTAPEFAQASRVVGTPTIVIYDLQGIPVARLAGMPQGSAEVAALARYAKEGAYENEPFARYLSRVSQRR